MEILFAVTQEPMWEAMVASYAGRGRAPSLRANQDSRKTERMAAVGMSENHFLRYVATLSQKSPKERATSRGYVSICAEMSWRQMRLALL